MAAIITVKLSKSSPFTIKRFPNGHCIDDMVGSPIVVDWAYTKKHIHSLRNECAYY